MITERAPSSVDVPRDFYCLAFISRLFCWLIGIVAMTKSYEVKTVTYSEQRPQNIYSQEEMNLYCIIKLATYISVCSLQISKT